MQELVQLNWVFSRNFSMLDGPGGSPDETHIKVHMENGMLWTVKMASYGSFK